MITISPRTLGKDEKISEPGVYALTMAQHHGQPCIGPSVTSSGLRTVFQKSAKHFWLNSSINPKKKEKEQTESMLLGRAAHHLFLGESEFQKHFIFRPDTLDGEKWNGNRNACKAWLGKQALAGLSVLKPDQKEKIVGMADAIKEHAYAAELLSGVVELSIVWFDAETRLWCLSRPDSLPLDQTFGSDLKCVAEIDDVSIGRSISRFGYYAQGSFFLEGMKNALGINLDGFANVFVETSEPHCVRVDSVAPEDLERGHLHNRLARKMIRKCLDQNYWPGPQGRDGDGGFFPLSESNRSWLDYRAKRLEQDIAA